MFAQRPLEDREQENHSYSQGQKEGECFYLMIANFHLHLFSASVGISCNK